MKLQDTKIIYADELLPVDPETVAELFANMDSEQQARFFNHVGEVASKWPSCIEMQLQYITDEDGLTLAGRRVMQGIGEYSHWGLIPHLRLTGEVR